MNAAKVLVFGSEICPRLWLLPSAGKLGTVSKKKAESKIPTGPYAQRAYAMAQWLTSLADWCDDGSAPPAARREFQKFWDVWTNMAAKRAEDQEQLLREHLDELCHECAQNLSADYDADKAAGLIIGAMRMYVDGAAALNKLQAQRSHIRTLVLAVSQGKGKRKEVTVAAAAEALFAALGWDADYPTFKRTRARHRTTRQG
jgi:hypothetical protein